MRYSKAKLKCPRVWKQYSLSMYIFAGCKKIDLSVDVDAF